MISQSIIQKAVALLSVARPHATIILFGSYGRGDAGERSDLDFLVIEAEVTARRREMVELSDLLRPLRIPADVLVVSKADFDQWAETPGTVIHAAAKDGKVLYAAA